MNRIQLLQKDGTIKLVKSPTYNSILWVPPIISIMLIAYFKNEILITPLKLLILSTELIGLTIIELCQMYSSLIVGCVAIGFSMWFAGTAIKALKRLSRRHKE